jgi:hypothetical protein
MDGQFSRRLSLEKNMEEQALQLNQSCSLDLTLVISFPQLGQSITILMVETPPSALRNFMISYILLLYLQIPCRFHKFLFYLGISYTEVV